jgi:ribosomal protein S27E
MKTIDDGETVAKKGVPGDLCTGPSDSQLVREPAEREMRCPVCGTPMPDLKGGKATLCPTCGFKDSCCY